MIELLILFAIAFAIIYTYFCVWSGSLMSEKGYGNKHLYALLAFFCPLLFFVWVLVPNRKD